MNPSMQNVLNWFAAHPNTPATVGDVAEQLGMKPSTTAGACLMLSRRGALSRNDGLYAFITAAPDMHGWLVDAVRSVQDRQLSAGADLRSIGVHSWRDIEPDMVAMSRREYNGLVADLLDDGRLVRIVGRGSRDTLRTPDLQQLMVGHDHRQEQLRQHADRVRRAIAERAEQAATGAVRQALAGIDTDDALVRSITDAVAFTLGEGLRRAVSAHRIDDTQLISKEDR